MELRATLPHARASLEGDFSLVISRLANSTKMVGLRTQLSKQVALLLEELKRSAGLLPLNEAIQRYVALLMLEAACFRYEEGHEPVLHHWSPVGYMRRFGRQAKGGRRVKLDSVSYNSGTWHEVEVDDRIFVHEPVDGVGFYQLNLERFFASVENRLGNAFDQMKLKNYGKMPYAIVAFVTFMLVQNLRQPSQDYRHGSSFSLRSLSMVAKELAATIDFMKPGFARMVSTDKPLAFTPYTPTRLRKHSDGTMTWFFPLSKHQALLYSQRELTPEEAKTTVETCRRAVIAQAKCTGTPIYGATKEEVIAYG